MERILIASRGEMARRLIRQFREAGLETVSVFSEPDVEQPWVDEADYPLYLNGRTVEETYLDPHKIVSAAMDSGCEVIHPGYCFLAERNDFLAYATSANIAVIGADREALARVSDRMALRAVAEGLSIPLIPASPPLDADDDGIAAAAQLGFPLYVKSVAGGAVERVATPSGLPGAVERVRAASTRLGEDGRVYLERAVEKLRQVGTLVIADRHGRCIHLGQVDGSMQGQGRTWIEEAGDAIVPREIRQRLETSAVALAKAVGWVAVGRVQWALTPDGGWYLLGFSARLTTGYSLVEQVHGIDLIEAQFEMMKGEPLTWRQDDVAPKRHGIQIRLLHVDTSADLARTEGVLERLVLPEGVTAEVGTAEGQLLGEDSDPIIAKLTITAPTRHAALVRARAAVEELVVEGVPTNRDALLRALGDPGYWSGDFDTHTVDRYIEA